MTQLPNNLYAVILAGGSGTRFWPLSRETWPKQMLQIVGEDTLIRQTIKRIKGFVPPENIWIVTTEDKAQDIRFHIESLGPLAQSIKFIKEPVGRNTAPAIGLAAIYLHSLSPESIMIVMPSDHAIPEREKFLSDLKLSIQGAEEDHLVTFGIKPNRPETGYGYIKVANLSKKEKSKLLRVERFVEKPDLQTAMTYLSNGSYFWNSGIFVWRTSKILSEIEIHLPDLYKTLKEIESLIFSDNLLSDTAQRSNRLNDAKTVQLKSFYSRLESLSIDYGIMEQSSNVLMVPATFQWSDLGSWAALDEVIEKDNSGNILNGNIKNIIDIGSENSILFSGERLIATIGLKDMVVVDTPDATLVTPKERVQEVRKIVEALKQNGREEHFLHKTVERPWGKYTLLEKGKGYKIKRIAINPGAKLSLQLHRRRSEHWVVVSGVAKVTREHETYLVHTNESTYIPINTKHRLENPGEILLQIIEVQNGDYVEEDDIERFDDEYGR
jgi:mannose-1-phosphate guanylyltransferase/mannose-6-phosphate isomerase